MNKIASPRTIGLFVVAAIALAIATVAVLGGVRFLRPSVPIVMYFQGSVAGLSVGSPVTFRGVKVGQVTNVFVRYDPREGSTIIPVFAEFYARNVIETDGSDGEGADKQSLRQAVEQGLRAQLTTQSLVTGQLVVNLDQFPETPANEVVNIYPQRLMIPTVPSPLQAVQATLQELYNRLQKLPIEELVRDASGALQGANRLLNDPRLGDTIGDANATMAHLRDVTATLDRQAGPLLEDLRAVASRAERAVNAIGARAEQGKTTIDEADKTLAEARKTLTALRSLIGVADDLVAPGAPLSYELVATLRQLGAAADAIRQFAKTLERTPNALVVGRPAAPAAAP